MKKRISIPLLFVIIFLILLTSNINALHLHDVSLYNIKDKDKFNNDLLFFENGIIIGRTYMTIKSKDAGVLQYVDLSIQGDQTKEIRSGVFGFFIVSVPLGRYKISGSKPGFYNNSIDVGLYWFKPFALGIIKLEKIGWN